MYGSLFLEVQEKAPASLALELYPQRKLNLALVIRKLLCDLACARVYLFREWGQVSGRTLEGKRAQTTTEEAGMIENVENLCTELQHAGLSQEAELGVLDDRK